MCFAMPKNTGSHTRGDASPSGELVKLVPRGEFKYRGKIFSFAKTRFPRGEDSVSMVPGRVGDEGGYDTTGGRW